jgi:hypothetical protein
MPGWCHPPCPQGLRQQQDPPAVSLQAAVRVSPAGGQVGGDNTHGTRPQAPVPP